MIYFILCCFHSKDHPSSPNWTLDFEPAFSPRFSPTLSPRSFFHIRQRFPFPNHVTSGSHEPAILFSIWSAVSPTGSSSSHVIALDQSEASICHKQAEFTTTQLILSILQHSFSEAIWLAFANMTSRKCHFLLENWYREVTSSDQSSKQCRNWSFHPSFHPQPRKDPLA